MHGIDKPDVRLVVHADVTESLDSYAQEIGRAARDGQPARAVLHYRPEDFSVRSFFAAGRAKPADVTAVWSALSQAEGRVRAKAVAEVAGVSLRTSSRILGSLVTIGASTSTAKGFAAAKGRTREEVVDAVREEDDAQRRIRESRIAVMRGYAEAVRCRRIALLDYFGVEAADACGACDRCDAAAAGEAATPVSRADHDGALQPDDAVEHAEWGAGTVVSVEDDRMTVFFEQQGYKVVAREALDRGILDVA